MKKRFTSIVLAVFSFAASVAIGDASTQAPGQPGSRYRRMLSNDQGLRKLATHAPAPPYPVSSLAAKTTGVAVAAVSIGPDGRTEKVDVVEAPDAAIERAVRDAVIQWVYRPVAAPVTGNLVFYFHRQGARGFVSSPDEMKALRGLAPDKTKPEPASKEILEADFARLTARAKPVVLDIRDRPAYLRAHRQNAVNIPVSELLTRGGAELPSSRPVVIDCFPEGQASNACTVAAHFLTSSGFSDVYVLKR